MEHADESISQSCLNKILINAQQSSAAELHVVVSKASDSHGILMHPRFDS